MPQPSKTEVKGHAMLKLDIICPDCGDAIGRVDLPEGKRAQETVRCDWDEIEVIVPAIQTRFEKSSTDE